MAIVNRLWKYITSASLYKQYSNGSPQDMYYPNKLERWGDNVIQSLNLVWNLGLYTSPVMVTFLYKRGYVVVDGFVFLTKVLMGIGIILSAAYCFRGIGRMNNPAYMQFYNVLNDAKKNLSKESKKKLMLYDFDFAAWPTEFNISGDARGRINTTRTSIRRSTFESFASIPCRLLSFLVAHTVALKLVYPGSIKSLQYFLSPAIMQGRMKLVETYNAERFKVRARDNNDIDVVFVDRRQNGQNGRTLVVCCEGNAGFYELGIMMTPIEAHYSVVGWNHPGFGGSTGSPYPEQEQNAVDVVMQFAINKLGFMPDDIILFGWSIGGYTSSWAAMNYPDVKGLILDATFDDILPLAVTRMPGLELLTRRVIRDYIDLNVYENVAKYPGPVTFIRRSEDEMICTEEGNWATNRGIFLAAKILKYRYPKIFENDRQDILNEWLKSDQLQQALIVDRYHVDKEICQSILSSYIEDNSLSYPMLIGDGLSDDLKMNLALFLAEKYMMIYRSTHCTPLPINLFRQPWTPVTSESSFVKL